LGNRNVTIGKDAVGNTIITGDGNIVIIKTSQTLDIISPKPDSTDAPVAATSANPYRGLGFFTEKDADNFFGRERLIEELWQKFNLLHQSNKGSNNLARILPIHGPSGCGKSSVVRAGLIPKLAQEPIFNRRNSRLLILTPGTYPLEALALAMARAITQEPSPVAKAREFEDEMKVPNQPGKYGGLRRIASTFEHPLTIFVDQFEELYSSEDRGEKKKIERQIFIANLIHAAADISGQVSVIITLRSDFINKVQGDAELYDQISGNLIFVSPMNRDELRHAIAKPAERAGRSLESGTVELLVRETASEEGALPLLQFTLAKIWDGLIKGTPPADTLRELGGVGGSLAQEAKRLFDGLDPAEKSIARRAFLRMVRVGSDIPNTSRKVSIKEVVSHTESEEMVRLVLEKFADRHARIISFAAELNSTETIRVAHEALLENWEDLRNWLENPEIRRNLVLYYRMAEAAQYWGDKNRPNNLLWSSGDLGQLRNYYEQNYLDLTQLQLDFLEASLNQKTKNRLIMPVFFLTLLAGTVIFFIIIFSNTDNTNNINTTGENTQTSNHSGDTNSDTATNSSAVNNDEVIDSDPMAEKRWENGRTLHIRFMGGSPAVQKKIKEISQEWTKYANLKFVFVSSRQAEIRIAFDRKSPSFTYIGTDSLSRRPNEATMNLGNLEMLDPESEDFRREVLHEFGHAIGLIHEHQQANANIPWNKPVIYEHFKHQAKAAVDQNLFIKYKSNYRPFDRDSIMMHVTIPKEWLIGDDFPQIEKLNTNLSESDKQLARHLYPPDNE
jgi:hypothetical protein